MKQEFKVGDWVMPIDEKRQYMIGKVDDIVSVKKPWEIDCLIRWYLGNKPAWNGDDNVVVAWPETMLLKISEEQAAIWLLEN